MMRIRGMKSVFYLLGIINLEYYILIDIDIYTDNTQNTLHH